jgi:ribonucleoside-diphosphate reductase alpha chain
LHQVHLLAWKKGVKSLYYCRSKSIQRSEKVTSASSRNGVATIPLLGRVNGDEQVNETDYEECLSCQ